MSDWLDRDQALVLLGVRAQTLYAYVSRKLLTARPDPADPRRSLYSRADAERLMARRARGRGASAVAETAIAWGEAILPTTISTVAGGRLFYRGRDAIRLAESATLEEAAALLWDVPAFPAADPLPAADRTLPPVQATLSMLATAAAGNAPSLGRSAASLAGEAAQLLRSIAVALGADLASGSDIASGFARRWGVDTYGAEAIRAALVVMADHELNASTFAARVTASTGAPLAAAALSGLSALLGPIHGGATLRVSALFESVDQSGAGQAVQDWLARGEPLPGFGHQLYPDTDPRAALLLDHVVLSEHLAELVRLGRSATGLGPNIDFASVALSQAHGLPKDAPFLLFAAARAAGWLAHAIEQAMTGRLIRPRARYGGPVLEPL